MTYKKPRPKRKPAGVGQFSWTSTIIVLAVLVAALLSVFRPWEDRTEFKYINLGLDLQGGLRVTLLLDEKNPKPDDIEKAKTIFENRVNALGVAEPLVQRQGDDRIVIELPGLKTSEQEKALKIVGQTAKLTFHIVKDNAQSTVETDPKTGKKSYKLQNPADLGEALATGDIMQNATPQADQYGNWVVGFTTTPEGSKTLEDITGKNLKKQMAIVLDGQIKSIATIQSVLIGGGQISGNFDAAEATDLALVIKSGALPVNVRVEEVRAIGPTLGADAIRSGALASIVGVSAVFVLAFIYYGFFFGLVIALGLLFSGIIILGILSGLGATLTLPGIAGLVLTIGAAVDGNVISFERVKEELRRGKGIRGAIQNGFGHSFWTIFDVNLSHLLAAFALANYSSGPVKGFAVTLAVGVIASAFSNLVFSKWLLETLARKFTFKAPDWFPTPKIDFIGASKFITTASVALALLGGLALLLKPLNYGVDFTGGTSYTVKADPSVQVEDVRKVLEKAKVKGADAKSAVIQKVAGSATSKTEDFIIKVQDVSDADRVTLSKQFETLKNAQVQQIEKVGPAVGAELRRNTVAAMALGLLLILVYVAFRFDVVFGVGSVVAVLHDVAIVMGMYTLLGSEFSIGTVAAILTLIGYSLNDSIIVSDRMRENLKIMRGASFKDIVNTSINQTLSRTIMTSLTTMLPLVSLFFIGGSVLRDFSLVLIVGIIIGTYSSIYIVAPMVVFYNEWRKKNKQSKPAKAA